MPRTSHAAAVLLPLALSFLSVRGEEPVAYRLKGGKSVASVSFELNSNKIFLPVRVNGGEQRWFVLGSGCPVTALERGLARELQLPVTGEREIARAGEGRAAVGNTKIDSLSLAGPELFPRAVWALGVNKPGSPSYGGRRIDGLLGIDFLERFVVRIDHPKVKSLTIGELKIDAPFAPQR
jgi:hypothetical protein